MTPGRALLDVNMLIALFDAGHTAHEAAHRWWADHQQDGWASCAITENGMVRIMSLPRYRPEAPLAINDLIAGLRHFAAATDHRFWSSEVSLCDERAITGNRIIGSRAITDVWLLALAVRHGGRLVTLDRRIVPSAVAGATDAHLCVV